ncbi:MAG: uroporphyrinogen-III synthase [Chitinophagaceae bacterium]|nr:uroporphyrinogen-III synthase [Polaromonas sp.]
MIQAIVTRPAQEAQLWADQLTTSGVDAQVLPLIEIAALTTASHQQALQQAWANLPRYAACMFVSGNAVEHFFKARHFFKIFEVKHAKAGVFSTGSAIDGVANDLPVNLRFMATGPGTLAALRAAGVPSGQIDAPPLDAAQFDSEALWRVVGQQPWQGAKVLIVRGLTQAAVPEASASPGRDWLSLQWQRAGAVVDELPVYMRRAPSFSAAQLSRIQAASNDGTVWLFSSSEAVSNLTGCPAVSRMDWRGALAIATHERIAQTARAAGWGVVRTSRPAFSDILSALRSIESSHS